MAVLRGTAAAPVGRVSSRYSSLVSALIFTSLLGVAAESAAYADDRDTGLRARLWVGAAGRYVLKDNEDFDSPPAGTVQLQVEGSSLALGGGVEYKFIKWIGVEGSIAWTRAPVSFHSSMDPGVTQHDHFHVIPLYLGVNVHVVNTRRVDLWFGPQLSYEIHPNNLSFDVNGAGKFDYTSSNPFSYIGFSVGADIHVDPRWSVNLGFRYQDADGDPDGHLTYDPTFVTVGATAKL